MHGVEKFTIIYHLSFLMDVLVEVISNNVQRLDDCMMRQSQYFRVSGMGAQRRLNWDELKWKKNHSGKHHKTEA